MQTTSVVCPSCGTVIDVSNDNLTVLSKYAEKTKVKPDIPIGSRGTFPDGTFEVIGFLAAIRYRRGAFAIAGGSIFCSIRSKDFVGYRNTTDTGTTSNPRPIGQAMMGNGDLTSRSSVSDTFSPLRQRWTTFSESFTGACNTASRAWLRTSLLLLNFSALNTPTRKSATLWAGIPNRKRFVSAFRLTTPLPPRIGVGASQPSPHTRKAAQAVRLAGLFIAIAFLLQIATLALSQNSLVYQTSLAFNAGGCGEVTSVGCL